MKKKIGLWFATVIGVIFLGFILVTLSYLINGEGLAKNFAESQVQMKEETKYQKINKLPTSTLDNFTDSLMLLTASYSGDESVFDRAMSNYRLNESGKDPYQTMTGNLDSEKTKVTSYARYWHGYLVFLRPLLSVFNYSEIRMINASIQIILLVTLIVMMFKKKIALFSIPLVAAYLMINPIAIANSLQYSSIWYIVLISMIVYLIFKDKIVENKLHYLLFTVVGMATSFFDLLTYPIATLGMLMVLVLVSENVSWKEAIKRILICGLCWTAGYGIMWASKWLIASLILNENVFKSAGEAIQARGSDIGNSGAKISKGLLLTKIFYRYGNVVTTIMSCANIILAIISFVCLKYKEKIITKLSGIKFIEKLLQNKKEKEEKSEQASKNASVIENSSASNINDKRNSNNVKKEKNSVKKRYSKDNKYNSDENKFIPSLLNSLPILAIGLMPFVWYFALTNHSYIHTFFTFRTLIVFWFAMFSATFKIVKDMNKKV
ncbi:MAG: hypothetical protein J6C46_12005 [Clostridia bacterium]|nr:hypothetical protein [Clostridia bacterium]